MAGLALLLFVFCGSAQAWTGEIRGRVVCDVCADSSVGPEDHVLEGTPSSLRDLTLTLVSYFVCYVVIYVQSSLRVETNPQFNFSCIYLQFLNADGSLS